MEEWKEYKIGDVCKIKRGASPRPIQQFLSNKGMPWVKIADATASNSMFLDSTKEYIIEEGVSKSVTVLPGTLIVSNSATPGLPKVIRIKACVHDGWLVISDFKGVLRDFMYYKFVDIRRNLSNQANGSVFQNLKTDIVRDYSINIPSLKTQEKIVSILKSLDDKIEINRKINENLEQQAQALFKSWFVDFEPFKNGEFVESELGMIPKGWRVGTFLDNIKVMPGGTPSTSRSEYWDDGTIPFFSPKDVNGVYCFETEKSITELGLNNCSSNLYPKDTLFITARGTVGKLTLAGVPMAMNQSNYALVAREGVGKYYLYLITQTLVSVLLKKANGAVFSAITTRDFNEPTLMPTHNDLKNFELLVTPIFKKIFQTSVESRHLAELRDTLLPKLMSGELKVNEVAA